MSQLKEITVKQYKEAYELTKKFIAQEYNKVRNTVISINEELASQFKDKEIDDIPVIIYLKEDLDTTTCIMKYKLDSNIEEDFDHNWWKIITPILDKYNIKKYRLGNKYMK